MSTLVRDVGEADFQQTVVEGSKTRPVVVDFWAEWCGPCRQLSPALEAAAERYAGEVDVVKVNVDENPRLAQQFRVQGIPAVKAFADGRMANEFTGLQPPQAIEEFFAGLAPSEADRLVAQADDDPARAEELLRKAMAVEVDHPGAAVGLATLLADRGDPDGAAEVLAKARPTDAVAQLRATLDLRQGDADVEALTAAVEAGDREARVDLGKALAAAGRYDEAIEVLLDAVRDPATRPAGRDALLDVFTALGTDDPRVRAARPKLASALF